jgi:hypothetical protein
MGSLRGRGVVTVDISLTNTQQRVARGTVHEAEEEKRTAAGAAAAAAGTVAAVGAGANRARAHPRPGAMGEGGRGVETEPRRAPKPNKLVLFPNDCVSIMTATHLDREH